MYGNGNNHPPEHQKAFAIVVESDLEPRVFWCSLKTQRRLLREGCAH